MQRESRGANGYPRTLAAREVDVETRSRGVATRHHTRHSARVSEVREGDERRHPDVRRPESVRARCTSVPVQCRQIVQWTDNSFHDTVVDERLVRRQET